LSNITQDGFAPCAFHSFPSTLRNDGISGDYGPGFFGYAVNTASFLTRHDEFGWIAMGGNIIVEDEWITMNLTTAARSRVFIAPVGVELSLDAGKFKSVSFNPETEEIKAVLDVENEFTPEALMEVKSNDVSGEGAWKVARFTKNDRNLYEIPLKKKERTIRVIKEN
jgi:hypothetical protein